MPIQKYRLCFCFWSRYKLRTAEPLEEIRDLFRNYSEDGAMSVDELHRFLIEVQGENNATRENAEDMFRKLKHLNFFQRKELHIESFFRYLLSDHNLIMPSPHKVHHDMSAPLAHYFIYTGHNSYLTGNQISSDSSVEPIIKALKRGVRVIELDLWPNQTRDDIIVDHGGTLTTPIKLINCLKVIKEYAFYSSEYPVIITFEDHLNTNLQAKVAKMVTRIFGRMLFSPGSDFEEFPSPEFLKRKILISTKPPTDDTESHNPNVILRHREVNIAADEEAPNKYQPALREIDGLSKGDLNEDEDQEDEEAANEAPEYRKLIAIHAVKLRGVIKNLLNPHIIKVRRLSLSEEDLENAIKDKGKDLVRFTRRNLLRIYPKGTRIFSSNYNPLTGWTHGAQMVAFNMQGYGRYLWIMQGMFRGNGCCGYIKKPDLLLSDGLNGEVFDPMIAQRLPIKTTIKIKLYMGEGWHLQFHHTHFDTCSPPDFYVMIGIAGVPCDEVTVKTKTDRDQWIPIWNEEFEFPLRVPELALLRLEVYDEDTSGGRDFGGQTCLPVSELRSGIRSVPLFDKKGNQYRSVKLLVRIEFL